MRRIPASCLSLRSRKRTSRGGDGSPPQSAVLPTKRGDEAVPASSLNASRPNTNPVFECEIRARHLPVYSARNRLFYESFLPPEFPEVLVGRRRCVHAVAAFLV